MDNNGYDKSAMPTGDIKVDEAAKEQVEAFMNDSDENTVLVDARPQESYGVSGNHKRLRGYCL